MRASPEYIRHILASSPIFRGRSYAISRIYLDDTDEHCFRLDLAKERTAYKLRLVSPTRNTSVLTEFEALRLLEQYGFDWAAGVVEFRVEEPTYLISHYAQGVSLDKSLDWLPHARSVADGLRSLLADFRKISSDRFGYMPRPKFAACDQFIDSRLGHYLSILELSGELRSDSVNAINTIRLAATDALRATLPSFLHFDIKPANILFDVATNKTTLIDFELARFGDIDFEFIKISWLARRWPEYMASVARDLVAEHFRGTAKDDSTKAKLLLYEIYHVCSLMAYSLTTRMPVSAIHRKEVAELLKQDRTYLNG